MLVSCQAQYVCSILCSKVPYCSVSNSVIVMLYTSTSFILVLTREGYKRNVNINAYPALTPHHSDIRIICTGGATIANLLSSQPMMT